MSELALQLIAEAKEKRLTTLDLGKCGLTEIPEELFELVWLEELSLSDQYWILDKTKKEWTNIQSENKGEQNRFDQLPQGFNKLLYLKKLILNAGADSDCKISDVSELSGLSSLRELYLDNNDVSDVSALSSLNSLSKLYLSSNRLTDPTALSGLNSLSELYLDDNQLSDVSMLSGLTSLKELYLMGNQLSDVSALSSLNSLSKLYLTRNQLTDVSALSELNSLSELYLGINQLTDVSALSRLSSLKLLGLNGNQLSDVGALSNLRLLTRLNLGGNQLSDVSALSNLSSLSELYLDNNQLSDVSALSSLRQLSRLDLSRNKVGDLGSLIGLIQKGIEVCLDDRNGQDGIFVNNNPLKYPSVEVVEQGNQAILSYFKSLKEQGTGKLNEAKLIIVGEPEAGKTTLVETLINPAYKLSDETESTLGIEVREGWQFPLSKTEDPDRQFSANIWDFGGQQIQYMTHQFFLTPSAGYVLLSANDRKEPTNFPYWFKIIHLLGEEQESYSPVLVVLNEKDDKFINKFNFDLKFYQDRYPELQIEVCEVDLSKRDARYNLLRETVQKQLINLPHVSDDRPARWSDIRKDLRSLAKTHDYINFRQYADICEQYGVDDEVDQRVLSGYLHRLGSLLHFSDDPSLRDFIILKPQWAVDAVYSVLVDNEIARNDGYFTQEKLDEVWKNYSLVERGHLLNLMKQENFEICYVLDCKTNTYIAPQLLSDHQADYAWDDTNNLKFRFQYTFMPEGIITRLIVRMNDLIAENEGCDLVWRKGVVLEQNGCRAQIKEEENRAGLKVIDIAVTGKVKERKFLLRKIREEIGAIHKKWFKNIQAEQMIPCHCDYCANPENTDTKYFELNVLERADERGKRSIECDKDFLDVSIKGLLEGVFEDDELDRSAMHRNEYGRSAVSKETNVTNHFHGHVGAIGGAGDNHKVTGKVILKTSDKQAIKELQESLDTLMMQVENYEAGFQIKMAAYKELEQIREHLANLENVSPEDQSKLRTLLGSIKDGSMGAIKLAKNMKESHEAVAWVGEKAAIVSGVLATLPV